jgi:hypothetical protein
MIRYNTRPTKRPQYSAIVLDNVVAGKKYIVASGPNGPYRKMFFNFLGVDREFDPVVAEIPSVVTQDTETDNLGTVTLGRIASQAKDYLQDIRDNAKTPEERVIKVWLLVYEEEYSEEIYSRELYAANNGVTIAETDVSLKLQFENPAKAQFPLFYDPDKYVGLLYG